MSLITASFMFQTARDAELERLKALATKLADKVNALGDSPEARLGAVRNRVN